MRVLVIDNYDSFVYNLVQYVGELGAEVEVLRNKVTLKKIGRSSPQKILISPGPGRPENAGISGEVVRKLGKRIPILGICLGHQTIGWVFGAKIEHAKRIMHGKLSKIYHDGKGVFDSLRNPIAATRYHSLIVREPPEELTVSARSDDGEIMGLRHSSYPIEGVQFHPESILTQDGKKMIRNFLEG
jgi:anthranilate synthase/phosphoribosyltransferase